MKSLLLIIKRSVFALLILSAGSCTKNIEPTLDPKKKHFRDSR